MNERDKSIRFVADIFRHIPCHGSEITAAVSAVRPPDGWIAAWTQEHARVDWTWWHPGTYWYLVCFLRRGSGTIWNPGKNNVPDRCPRAPTSILNVRSSATHCHQTRSQIFWDHIQVWTSLHGDTKPWRSRLFLSRDYLKSSALPEELCVIWMASCVPLCSHVSVAWTCKWDLVSVAWTCKYVFPPTPPPPPSSSLKKHMVIRAQLLTDERNF